MNMQSDTLTVPEIFNEMENDLDRYPLPLCFDAGEEQRELWRRHMALERIAERFVRYKNYLKQKGDEGI